MRNSWTIPWRNSEKNKEKLKTNCSNEDFLRKSEIKICIKKDCLENINRIDELIHRTNQLNFTKKRDSKEDLKKYFEDKSWCRCGESH